MWRVVLELGLAFIAPFLLFLLYRLIRPDEKERTDAERFRPYAILTLAGLLLVAVILIGGRLMTERHTGAYSPPVVKDGVVQPGRVE
jgi:hypothetical protein